MEEWEVEDAGVGLKEVTKRVVNKSMQEVLPFLNITTEIGEDFEDGWLPTLDISLKVDEREQVLWKIYEKPTASKVTVQSRSVMGGGCCNIVPRDIVPRDIVPRNIVPRDFVRRKHCSKDNIVQRTTLFQGGKNMYLSYSLKLPYGHIAYKGTDKLYLEGNDVCYNFYVMKKQ